MNKEKSFEEKVEREEWGAWKFVSEMLDVPHPDEELAKYGIYNTSKCYEQIHDFVVEQKQKALTQHTAELKKKIEGKRKDCYYTEKMSSLENHIKVLKDEEYNKALDDIIKELNQQ